MRSIIIVEKQTGIQKKMVAVRKSKTLKQKIIIKLIKYFIFTIFMAWSPIIVNCFVCYIFELKFKEAALYTPEICFMTIILASTNLKDLLESRITTDSLIFVFHIILNVLNIALSLIFIGISAYIELSGTGSGGSLEKQFIFVIAMYILAVLMGSSIQIGGAIKWIK